MRSRIVSVATSPTYPPVAQLRVLAARLAKIAKVPTNYQHEFCERIVETVLSVRARDRRSTGEIAGPVLRKAADAARRLQDAYSHMNELNRHWIEHIKRTQMQFMAGEIQHVEATITNLVGLFHTAAGEATPIPASPK